MTNHRRNSSGRHNSHRPRGRSNSMAAVGGRGGLRPSLRTPSPPGPSRQPLGPTVEGSGFASNSIGTFHPRRDSPANGGASATDSPRRRGAADSGTRLLAVPHGAMVIFDVPAVDPGTIISISAERARPGAIPNRPSFIPATVLSQGMSEFAAWNRNVLSAMATRTFVISNGVDLEYFSAILSSPSMPGLYRAITSVCFDQFYWFSGVKENRMACPALVAAENLPGLQRLSLTFHTAGLTWSSYTERERMRIEEVDLEQSKQLKPMPVEAVITKYDLAKVFNLDSLKTLELKCINSNMVANYCTQANPMDVFWALRGYFNEGFVNQGRLIAIGLGAIHG
ncbi:hypothetical protein P280DRAFT_483855 [Massarina eburnea CBS 473.64]|uniref:Uncharacterized protein n=1 Tax=Massarina eburnea CBS 473.64 TaxID=1395130 RepID=A0A6A6RL27_9PLEO|nr:hypothetical protein P280DRAFT_483855 [Massarina eburnea CBS 473.64]